MTSSRPSLSVPGNESFSPDARACFNKQTNLIIGVSCMLRCVLQSDADVSEIKGAIQLATELLESANEEFTDLYFMLFDRPN